MRKFRVLLCDDEAQTRTLYPERIQEEWNQSYPGDSVLVVNAFSDIYVGETSFGESPISIHSVGGHYDLVLLDIAWLIEKKAYPKGVEIASLLRDHLPEIPILIFSEGVTPRDFEKLIPLKINGFVSKGEHSLAALVGQIYRVLNDSLSDKAGFPMYQNIRRVLGSTDPSKIAWMRDVVDSVATDMWKHEHPYEKWDSFWSKWQNELHKNGLGKVSRRLSDFFESSELLMLAVHSGFRGHLEHVLHVYFTGYVISHMIPEFRKLVHASVLKVVSNRSDLDEDSAWNYFQFCWLLAATLHDVGYPIEMLPTIAKHAKKVHDFFQFAKFSPAIPDLVLNSDLTTTSEFKKWKFAYTDIMVKLYGAQEAEIFTENTTFRVPDGSLRFNHGVASGIKLLSLSEDVSKPNDLPQDCLKWISVAMGLHSLKRVEERHGVQLNMEKDPLSFLLFLSDELQVWNRTRPDEIESKAIFKTAKLKSFDINPSTRLIRLEIEYDLYSFSDRNVDTSIRKISESIESDGVVLNKFLSMAPYRLEINNTISGVKIPLATLHVR